MEAVGKFSLDTVQKYKCSMMCPGAALILHFRRQVLNVTAGASALKSVSEKMCYDRQFPKQFPEAPGPPCKVFPARRPVNTQRTSCLAHGKEKVEAFCSCPDTLARHGAICVEWTPVVQSADVSESDNTTNTHIEKDKK